MPFVTIFYGPYLCHGTINHRVQKVNGLFKALDNLGYELEVVAINEYNRLSIEMYDREIFRCDIRNLMFNAPMEDDPVCQRAVKAVEEAKQRMTVDENVPRFSSLSEGVRELTSEPMKAQICDSLPSKTELIYELRQENLQRTLSRHLHDHIKGEGKISKVKIMEGKNVQIFSEETLENSGGE